MHAPYNPILDTDSYKLFHHAAYPPELERVYSYAESRGGRYDQTVFFGLQPWLLKLTEHPINAEMIVEAKRFAEAHGFEFNEAGWRIIEREHNGFLPLEIRAVPEGTLVPTRNVLCTVENTDERLPWLTSYIETSLLRQLWYGTTVATRVHTIKTKLSRYFDETSNNRDGLPFALLDFSSRGCAGYDANELGAAAYLAMGFKGSDSLPGVRYANTYYFDTMSGFSVPATEHSVTTAWGRDREEEGFLHALDAVPYGGNFSSVIDTWNCFDAAGIWARPNNRAKLRTKAVTLIERPDSGEPKAVLPPLFTQALDSFGFTLNSKGYAVLNGAKMLWGDGIDEDTCVVPFEIAKSMGISADSIMVGSGGGLMQRDLDRDTCKFAFKASAVKERGVWCGVAKDPITDPGKASKRGKLLLHRGDSGLVTLPRRSDDAPSDELRLVYHNGVVMTEDLATIRSRVEAQG